MFVIFRVDKTRQDDCQSKREDKNGENQNRERKKQDSLTVFTVFSRLLFFLPSSFSHSLTSLRGMSKAAE